MNIDDLIEERVEAARRRIQRQQADRLRRQRARIWGKNRAHATRVARWAAEEKQDGETSSDR